VQFVNTLLDTRGGFWYNTGIQPLGVAMENMVKLTVNVPEHVRREARAKAIREGTNVTTLIRAWLAEYIKAPPPEADK